MKKPAFYYLLVLAAVNIALARFTPRWILAYRKLWFDGEFPRHPRFVDVVARPSALWLLVAVLALCCAAGMLFRKADEPAMLHATVGLLAIDIVLFVSLLSECVPPFYR